MTEQRTPYTVLNKAALETATTVRIGGELEIVEAITRHLRACFLVTSEVDYPRTHGGVWRYLEIEPLPSGASEAIAI